MLQLSALCCLLGGSMYLFAAGGAFVADDKRLLLHIIQGGPFAVWSKPGTDFFRPLVSVTLWAEHSLFGTNSLSYHLVNILLLIATGVVVVALWERSRGRPFFRSGSPVVPSVLLGLLFTAWPNHSEPVNWISCVGDLVGTLSMGLCLVWFLAYRAGKVRNLALSMAALAFALLTKETAIVMPFILLLFALFVADKAHGSRRWAQLAFEALVVAAITVAYMLLRRHILGDWIGGYGAQTHLHFVKPDLINKAYLNLSNVFMPFNRELALRVGGDWMKELLLYGLLFLLISALRALPGNGKVSTAGSRVLLVGFAVCLFWLLHTVLLSLVAGLDELIPDEGKWSLLALALAVSIWRRRDLSRAAGWFGRHRVVALWAITAVVWIDWRFAWLPPHDQYFLIAFLVWGLYTTRPPSESDDDQKARFRFFLVTAACTALCLLPALTLSIKLNGESERFSYTASLFGVLTLGAWYSLVRPGNRIEGLFSKEPDSMFPLSWPWVSQAAAGVLLFVCLVLLPLKNHVLPWAAGGRISSELNDTLQNLHGVSRVFLVAGPDTMDGAFVLRGGVKETAALLGLPMQVHSGAVVLDEMPRDRVSVIPKGAGKFLVQIQEGNDRRLYDPVAEEYAEKDPLVTCGGPSEGIVVTLPPLGPQDKAIYFDGAKWVTIR